MTTVLYVKGDGLYTDSRHVKQIDKMYFASEENKIRVSKDKTFAWAVTGEYTVANLDDIEMLIRKFLIDNKNQVCAKGITYTNNGDVRKLFDGTAIIVTATGYGFVFIEGDSASNLSEVDYISVGSGSPFATATMRLSGNPNEAMRIAVTNDLLSGGDIHHLSLSELVIDPEFIRE